MSKISEALKKEIREIISNNTHRALVLGLQIGGIEDPMERIKLMDYYVNKLNKECFTNLKGLPLELSEELEDDDED